MGTKPAPQNKAGDDCSLCGHSDFRKCPCPWGRQFDQWPGGNLAMLKRALPVTGPSAGS